jgi:hypothetical protein
MNKLFFLLLFASSPFWAYSQVRSGTDAHKWEVGLDMRPFIDTSFHLRESVLFKYRPNDKYKYRLRLGFAMVKSERRFPFKQDDIDTLWIVQPTLYAALGAERRVFSSRKVYIGLGADAFLFYGFRNEDYHFDNTPFSSPATNRRRVIRDRDLRTGLNLLLNCEYLLTERLSLGVEAFWQLAYRHLQLSEETKVGPAPIEITQSGTVQNRFSSHVQPFSALNILFRF